MKKIVFISFLQSSGGMPMNTNYPFPLRRVGTSVSQILLLLTLLNTLLFSQDSLTRTQAIMGTFVHITLPKEHNKAISTSFAQLKELEATLGLHTQPNPYCTLQPYSCPCHHTFKTVLQRDT